MPERVFTEADVAVGDWIKYREPLEKGGGERIAEIRSFYPFGKEPTADTTLGHVKVSTILESRRKR